MELQISNAEAPQITPERIQLFLQSERSTNPEIIRQRACILKGLYASLPADKQLTKERLVQWRHDLEERGCTPMTVASYAKCANRYLRWIGSEELCFTSGKIRDLTGARFGRMVVQYPTDQRKNGSVIWHCVCDCGNEKDVPGCYLTSGNVSSCGCYRRNMLNSHRKLYEGTSLYQSMTDTLRLNNTSGHTGVYKCNGHWAAMITYKGVNIYLGNYETKEEAVRVRQEAKRRVSEDAAQLLDRYYEEHPENKPKSEMEPSNGKPEGMPRKTGVTRRQKKWVSQINCQGKTYFLGHFEDYEDALRVREGAEEIVRSNPCDANKALMDYKKMLKEQRK